MLIWELWLFTIDCWKPSHDKTPKAIKMPPSKWTDFGIKRRGRFSDEITIRHTIWANRTHCDGPKCRSKSCDSVISCTDHQLDHEPTCLRSVEKELYKIQSYSNFSGKSLDTWHILIMVYHLQLFQKWFKADPIYNMLICCTTSSSSYFGITTKCLLLCKIFSRTVCQLNHDSECRVLVHH